MRDWKRLRPGDVITLGEHTLTFCAEAAGEEEEDREPEGTRVFSVRELSAINTRPAIDPGELQRQNRVLAILSKAASELVIHQPLDKLFDTILNLLLEAVAAERGAILLLEGGPPAPVIKASRSRQGEPLTHISRSIARRAIDERVSLLLPNVLEDVRFKSEDSILASGIRTAMCAPLWFASTEQGRDAVIGLVYVDSLQHSHSFTEDDLRVLTALANVAAAKIENVRLLEESLEKRRMEEDMRMAAEIQNGLLPREAPHLDGLGPRRLQPPLPHRGRRLLRLRDRGRPPPRRARRRLRQGDRGGAPDDRPARRRARALDRARRCPTRSPAINRTVCQNVPSSKYVTFFLAALDPATGRLAYVNAGHNPPLLVRAGGKVERLEEGGLVLGMFENVVYAGGSVDMRLGDTLVVYSDGVTETWSPEGEEFGEESLTALAVRSRTLDADSVQNAILREIERFEAGARATDDRTLVILKRAGRPA